MTRVRYREAAGLEIKRRHPPAGPAPSKSDLAKLYVKEGRSVRDAAAALGCSKDAVRRIHQKYGIKASEGARRWSALLKYRLPDLKATVRQKELRGYAGQLAINPSTLTHHLKVREGKIKMLDDHLIIGIM